MQMKNKASLIGVSTTQMLVNKLKIVIFSFNTHNSEHMDRIEQAGDNPAKYQVVFC